MYCGPIAEEGDIAVDEGCGDTRFAHLQGDDEKDKALTVIFLSFERLLFISCVTSVFRAGAKYSRQSNLSFSCSKSLLGRKNHSLEQSSNQVGLNVHNNIVSKLI